MAGEGESEGRGSEANDTYSEKPRCRKRFLMVAHGAKKVREVLSSYED